MIHLKTEKEIAAMKDGGKILADVLLEVLSQVKPGVSEIALDKYAESLIRKKGAEPGFQRVKGYEHTICISTNDIVVHGMPTAYILKKGDVVGIDCGVYYKGFHTDMSETIRVQSAAPNVKSSKDKIDIFLQTGKRALEEAIKEARVGNRVGNISKKIQDIVEGAGYSVVRSLVGHGVGKSLHEEPEVPGFLTGSMSNTPKLRHGMVLAIEVIYNMGRHDVRHGDDPWTIRTVDKTISGLFERTIVITEAGPVVLTV